MSYIEIEHHADHALVYLSRPKVNALNYDLVKELRKTFALLKDNEDVHGVILSARGSVFSAGLDVIELYQYDQSEVSAFFAEFGGLYADLVKFPKPLIAAINGACPAGGCVMAIAADYRIMVDDPRASIGLNEVAANILISNHIIYGYSYWIGNGAASRYILTGELLSAEEAFEVGLVDQLANEEQMMIFAEDQLDHYFSYDRTIWRRTKNKLRQRWIELVDQDMTAEWDELQSLWWSPSVRARMEKFIISLKK